MSMRNSWLVVVFVVVTAAVFAQVPATAPPTATEPPMVAAPAEPQDPTPGGVPEEEPEAATSRPREVGPDTVVDGDHGTIDFTSPDPYGTAGIVMRANQGWLDIVAKVGGTGSGSGFSVVNSSDQSVFRVTGYGTAGIGTASPSSMLDIERNQDNGTVIELNNANTGSSSTTAYTGLKFMEGATLKAAMNSVGSGSTLSPGGPGTFQLWNYPAAPMLFATSATERMRITATGNVGIGTTSPAQKLAVLSQSNSVAALFAQASSVYGANTTTYETAATGLSYQNISTGVTNSGTGIGQRGATTLFGAGTLVGATGLQADVSVETGQTGTIANAIGLYTKISRNQGTITNGYGIHVGNVEATNAWGIYQSSTDDANYFGGAVTVAPSGTTGTRLTVNGDINVTGTITGAKVVNAVYQDVAEWVPASADMEPGTVVVLNRDRNNEVMPSHHAYDTGVAGVVSAQPGILLGIGDTSKEQIATTGRVRVRVDATRSPIRIGDLLVTSDIPGTAMRSDPIQISGRTFHQPGTIIGKALEPLADGEGEILVLLSLQ